MADREKLIELRREAEEIAENFCVSRKECYQCPYDPTKGCQEGIIADHLIANGVTIQKWIPVTERLPETTCLNLAIIGEVPFLAYYDGRQWRSSITLRALPVEYWMPLPEPPKGECV